MKKLTFQLVLIASLFYWTYFLGVIYLPKDFLPLLTLTLLIIALILIPKTVDKLMLTWKKHADPFYFLSWTKYNPKAKLALGKSMMNISDTIFKGVFSLFFVLPLILIFKGAYDGKNDAFSIFYIVEFLPVSFVIILIVSIFFAVHARLNALKIINSISE